MSELYAAIRAEPDPLAAWELWKGERDRLLPDALAEPDPADGARRRHELPSTTPYDPALRTVADVGSGRRRDIRASGLDVRSRHRRARRHRRDSRSPASRLSLSVFWLTRLRGRVLRLLSRRHQRSRDIRSRSLRARYRQGRRPRDRPRGGLILDFNFSYQPSCSYDPRWSCPLPPRENWLTVPIRTGERFRG